MKLGYACQNWSSGLNTNHSFRLKSFTEKKFIQTIEKNINDFSKILDYNLENNFLFFRLGSNFIPFASHPICQLDWQNIFKKDFSELAKKIRKYKMRISMHPGQFTVLNSKDPNVIKRAISEISYHSQLMELLELDDTAKIQIHVGFPYDNKENSIKKFINIYRELDTNIKKRLAIENDDKFFRVSDCLTIHDEICVPIILDTFHFRCLPDENFFDSANLVFKTWKKKDGIPMIDYSSQEKNSRKGKHSTSLDPTDFIDTIKKLKKFDFDILLELKDKESSALRASNIIKFKKL